MNYGDGLFPLDKWFGTWHDGTAEGEARMQARYEKRRARANREDDVRLPDELLPIPMRAWHPGSSRSRG